MPSNDISPVFILSIKPVNPSDKPLKISTTVCTIGESFKPVKKSVIFVLTNSIFSLTLSTKSLIFCAISSGLKLSPNFVSPSFVKFFHNVSRTPPMSFFAIFQTAVRASVNFWNPSVFLNASNTACARLACSIINPTIFAITLPIVINIGPSLSITILRKSCIP